MHCALCGSRASIFTTLEVGQPISILFLPYDAHPSCNLWCVWWDVKPYL